MSETVQLAIINNMPLIVTAAAALLFVLGVLTLGYLILRSAIKSGGKLHDLTIKTDGLIHVLMEKSEQVGQSAGVILGVAEEKARHEAAEQTPPVDHVAATVAAKATKEAAQVVKEAALAATAVIATAAKLAADKLDEHVTADTAIGFHAADDAAADVINDLRDQLAAFQRFAAPIKETNDPAVWTEPPTRVWPTTPEQ